MSTTRALPAMRAKSTPGSRFVERYEDEEPLVERVRELEQRARSLEQQLAQRERLEAALRHALAHEQQAREQAERAAQWNDTFVGMLGHDLRNPIGAIAIGASHLGRTCKDDSRITRTTARILTSTDRLTAMTDQLVDFSRIQRGRIAPLRPSRFDVAEVCARVKAELEAAHPDCAISVELEGDTAGTWDPERLLQMFSNVIGNAASHGPAEHGVAIRIDGRDPDRVEASVHNAGAISPEVLPKLFEPLRGGGRQHNTRALGLGLFITRYFVHAHGGTIEATSSEADGTTIRICLPRITRPPEDRSSTP